LTPSLLALLSPKSIAVVGASPDERRFGGRALRNVLSRAYSGRVIPVNPKYPEIHGLKCYPDVQSIEGDVDLVLLAVPQSAVRSAVVDSAEKGARLGVIFSSGYAEAGSDGAAAQHELVKLARAGNMRLIGPNCLGFLNTADHVAGSATAILQLPDIPSGPISLVSQSGAMGFVATFNRAYDAGVGFRYVVATGNEADLTLCDFLEAFIDDEQTRVCAALIESIREPERFRALAARAFEVGKPLVVLKVGRSTKGVMAAAAHTAALAGSDAVHDAVFSRDAVIRVDEIDELWQVPHLLSSVALPRGRRVAVISTSGGFNGIIADQFDQHGLELPDLSSQTEKRLRELLPSFAYFGNPLDLTGQFSGAPNESDVFAETLRLLDDDPNVDAIVLVQIVVRGEFADVIQPLVRQLKELKKPALLLGPGGSITDSGFRSIKASGIPILRSARECARALRFLCEYGEARRHPRASARGMPSTERARVATGVMGFRETEQLLAAHSIRMVRQHLVQSEHAAFDAANDVGFPVVVKAVGSAFAHKTDAGAVRLRVDEAHLASVYAQMRAIGERCSSGFDGVLIQPMSEGLEMIVGLKCDRQFGPMVVFGAGGILTEILGDVVIVPPPIDAMEVVDLLRSLRVWPMFAGYRGEAPRDTSAFARLVSRVGDLALEVGNSLEALDMNPVFVGAEGTGVSIVDALVVGASRGGR
jgi:acyl-CoA synthetase (NDP forming)